MRVPSALRHLALLGALGLAGACGPSGGGSSGPPPGAGADPGGSWRVEMLLTGMVGACSGTYAHRVFWNFVPIGTDEWDVEMLDLQGRPLGVLHAEQLGSKLSVTGEIPGWAGFSPRRYESSDLYATDSALAGWMTVAHFNCVDWGPLSGFRDALPATAGVADEALTGHLELRGGGSSPAALHAVSPGKYTLTFGDDLGTVISPRLAAGPDGVLAALFAAPGAAREYALLARRDHSGRVTGEVTALDARDGAILWRADLSLARRSTLER